MLSSLLLLLDDDAHCKFTAASVSVTFISINPAVASGCCCCLSVYEMCMNVSANLKPKTKFALMSSLDFCDFYARKPFWVDGQKYKLII
jgi:hypothetical protein